MVLNTSYQVRCYYLDNFQNWKAVSAGQQQARRYWDPWVDKVTISNRLVPTPCCVTHSHCIYITFSEFCMGNFPFISLVLPSLLLHSLEKDNNKKKSTLFLITGCSAIFLCQGPASQYIDCKDTCVFFPTIHLWNFIVWPIDHRTKKGCIQLFP